jgi:hypothetical protein
MKQRSLNSHFKIKKNKHTDGIQSGKEKVDIGISEKKMRDTSGDDSKLVILSNGSPNRAKRMPRESEDSADEPEVIGRRVKIEKKKAKVHHDAENNIDILQSFKKSNGKNLKKEKNQEIAKSKMQLNEEDRNGLKCRENKKSPKKDQETQEDVTMIDINELYDDFKAKATDSKSTYSDSQTESKSPVNLEISYKTKSINQSIPKKKNELESLNKISPSSSHAESNLPEQVKISNKTMSVIDSIPIINKEFACEKKTTTFTSQTESKSPEQMKISNKTKSLIESILKNKKQQESAKKTTDSFNYLNFSSSAYKTPVKSDYLLSNINSYQKINNNFSINNSSVKDSISSLTTPNNKPVELKLSQRTIDAVNQLKSERKNNFERNSQKKERVRSESSFSLKYKYEDLIKEERELILPPHYKKLLQSFTELDLIMNHYKMSSRRNAVPVFEDIQQSIESTYKHKFDFKTFAQILYVTPHLFIYKWQKMNLESEDFSLIVDIPKDHHKRLRGENLNNHIITINNQDEEINFTKLQTENYDPAMESLTTAELEERKKVFKNALIAITNHYHGKFLESLDFARDFDPIKLKTWHHGFDLENVTPVPIFEILEKPTIKITSIKEFLETNDIKNSLIKRAIEGINSNISEDNNNFMGVFNNCSNSNANEETQTSSFGNRTGDQHLSILSKYLQPSLLKKIVAKEEAVNISNEFRQYSAQIKREMNKTKEYESFIDNLKTIFIINNSPSISINELIGRLSKAGGMNWSFSEGNYIIIFNNLLLAQIRKIILKLCDIFPNWIRIHEHSNLGTLVIMEKSVSVVEIRKKVSDSHTIELLEN